MTAIDRTAYPRLIKQLSEKELSDCYELNSNELNFIQRHARNDRGYLVLAVLLKTRQQLGYFTALKEVPMQIVMHLSGQLDVEHSLWNPDENHYRTTLHRYRTACRKLLGSTAFSTDSQIRICACIRRAAQTMSDPADLINVSIEELVNTNIELPAFSTLDRIVGHERHQVHNELYARITRNLDSHQKQVLDSLMVVQEGKRITEFARMKQIPGPATLKHFRAWADRLVELDLVMNTKPFFEGIAHTKIRQFSSEAGVYEISDMRGIKNESKRHTLLLSLLYSAQSKSRDEIIEMFLRRMRSVKNSAQSKLRELQEKTP